MILNSDKDMCTILEWANTQDVAIKDAGAIRLAQRVFNENYERDAQGEYQQTRAQPTERCIIRTSLRLNGIPVHHQGQAEHEKISVSRQCELLGISRSGLYYKAIGESVYNFQLMRLIDEYYTRYPFYGVRRLTEWLRNNGMLVQRVRSIQNGYADHSHLDIMRHENIYC